MQFVALILRNRAKIGGALLLLAGAAKAGEKIYGVPEMISEVLFAAGTYLAGAGLHESDKQKKTDQELGVGVVGRALQDK